MSEFTPGPWTLSPKSGRFVIGSDQEPIYTAHTGRGLDEVEANARLIAAAPEMLAALEDLLAVSGGKMAGAKARELTKRFKIETELVTMSEIVEAVWRNAEATVAKARGQ